MATAKRKPWNKANPKAKSGRSAKLTSSEKTTARKAAKKAGRRYPNLVDNMRVAENMRRGANRTTEDPKGGLTAAGRAEFRRKEGAHLKPGVKKAKADMTAQDKKRTGSWAVRFYGRSGKLPALVSTTGKPTRFALSAAAWGEPVPKTAAAARRIAAKGRKLLSEYKREPKA